MNNKTFRTEFSESIFNYKYKHENANTWQELSKTLIEDVCKDYLSQEEKNELVEMHSNMEFIAGGRYLYYAGRDNKYFNNCYLLKSEEDSREDWANLSWKAESCLMTGGGIGNDYSIYRAKGAKINKTGGIASGAISKMKMINEIGREVMQGGSRRCLAGNTLILTKEGIKPISEITNNDEVISHDGKYHKVIAQELVGVKPVVKIITSCGSVVCTSEHRWLIEQNWLETNQLEIGDSLSLPLYEIDGTETKLPSWNYIKPKMSTTCKDITIPILDTGIAWLFGQIHGDGYVRLNGGKGDVSVAVAFNDGEDHKNFAAEQLQKFGTNVKITKGDGNFWKIGTESKQLASYMIQFKQPNSSISVPDFILQGTKSIRAAYIAGLMDADGGAKNRPILIASSIYLSYLEEIKVILSSLGIRSRVYLNREEVGTWKKLYHLTLQTNEDCIKFNEIVGKFSFKCKKDNIIRKRERGLVKDRFKAEILEIVELGEEEVYDIQVADTESFIANGFISHNSAIYASLNWLHADAGEFLHCKDWYSMPIAGAYDETGRNLTIGELKEKDFNYPAPLDMTNISLNYDNKFLEEIYGKSFNELLNIYKESGKNAIFNLPVVKIPITFLENCRQALKTGEPGFSFNFFEKVLETLRNACTEVTSEDDSDVCNLASINLSKIKTKARMTRVCYLVSKFLLCGTMVAQLPYQKVYEVRVKNRRLGLGLMGVHEWLLQRGYKYEVTPELHEWLKEYKEQSEIGANELAEKLSINKPIAYRAIAPTGKPKISLAA